MKPDEQKAGRVARSDRWVYLDRWWAQRLGVKRTAGMYRIRSRELVRRFSRERLGVDSTGTVFVYGRFSALSANRQKPYEPAHKAAAPQCRGRY
jgi:hypothetical protein